MTRMGDIIQTTPLLRALKEKEPGVEIYYFAVSGFSDICEHIPEIDHLVPFDFNTAVAISKSAIQYLPRRIKEMQGFLKTLQDEKFDEVINVSHSRISALITHFFALDKTRGLTLNSEGYRLIKHPWTRYFFIANLNRHYNRINLVDINIGLSLNIGEFAPSKPDESKPFGRTGLSYEKDPKAEIQAQNLLKDWPGNQAPLKIGFQPGASLDCKRWRAESFVQLGEMLHRQFNASILVFGTEKEKKLASAVCDPLGDFAINLAGKTDIPALGALLDQLDLLITNDTGTQHLAAAVDTPVLSLCFGSALSHETGPYGHGHVVMESTLSCFPCSFHVECKRFRCQESVTPEAVMSVAAYMLNREPLDCVNLPDNKFYENVQVWRTDFEEDGFWILRPMIVKPLTAADAISITARMIWKKILTSPNEMIEDEDSIDRNALLSMLVGYQSPETISFTEEMREPLTVLGRLVELSEKGQDNCSILLEAAKSSTPDLSLIETAGKEIEKIDQEISITGFRLPEVNHLILDFTFRKQNLEGNDLVKLTVKTKDNYVRMEANARIFRDVLQDLQSAVCDADWRSVAKNERTIPVACNLANCGDRVSEEALSFGLGEAV